MVFINPQKSFHPLGLSSAKNINPEMPFLQIHWLFIKFSNQ